jgi:hypothetical protein
MTLSIYPTLVISRHAILRRLRPILANLPPTNERITRLEERQAIQAVAKAAPAPGISPKRRRIVRIASAVAVVGTLGVMIARAIDIYEPNQSILLALYLANANLHGLLNVVGIVAFGFLLVTFGRSSPNAVT